MTFQKIFILLYIIITTAGVSIAQVTYSPYTLFGQGQIEENGFGVNKALGGTGIAFQSGEYLNNINPASYSGIDSTSVFFEFGAYLKNSTFSTNESSYDVLDANLRYLAMGCRMNKWWSGSVGIVPFSSVNYKIVTEDFVEGLPERFTKTYSGKGGITQLYMSNAFDLFKGLSIGVNTSYLFGNINKTEEAEDNSYYKGYSVEYKNHLSKIYLDFGMQYSYETRKYKYSVGMVYAYHTNLNTENDITFFYKEDSISLEFDENDNFELPRKLGFGFALEKKYKYRLGFDYENRNWETSEFTNPILETRNSERFSIGGEYVLTGFHLKGLKTLIIRAGANYNKTYLIIDGVPINSKVLSLGVGLPVKQSRNLVNISFEYGQTGTLKNELINETYWMIHLNATMHELWFKRNQIR